MHTEQETDTAETEETGEGEGVRETGMGGAERRREGQRGERDREIRPWGVVYREAGMPHVSLLDLEPLGWGGTGWTSYWLSLGGRTPGHMDSTFPWAACFLGERGPDPSVPAPSTSAA